MEQVKRDRFMSYQPRRIARFEMRLVTERAGQKLYTLKNTERYIYLRLTEKGRILWDMMDGTRDIAAILNECTRVGQPISIEKLATFLDLLESKAMLQLSGENTDDQTSAVSSLRLLGKALVYREWAIEVGGLVDWLYRHVGWLFYARPVIVALGTLSILGPLCFVAAMLCNPHATATGSVGTLHAVIMMAIRPVVVIAHESAHAFTCRRFGCEVPRVGLALYYGSLCTFVDTSDVWMCDKSKRVLTSAAGPISSWVLGSLASVLAFILPFPAANQVLFQAAAWCFLASLFPLNPIMEFDGYYMLVDWLEVPFLRRKSFRFIAHQLLPRLRSRTLLNRRERVYLIYGLLALAFSVFSVLTPFYLVLNHSIRGWIASSGVLWVTVPVFATMGLSLTLELIARIINWTRGTRGRDRAQESPST